MRTLLVILIAVAGWAGIRQARVAQRAAFQNATPAAETGIVLYVTPGCTPCDLARAHLDARGAPYTVHDIEADSDSFEAYLARGGTGDVPMLRIGEATLLGFSPDQVDARLATLGF